MIRLAIKKYPKFSISRYELKRHSSTYTKKSISYFKQYYSRSCIYFLIGGDSLRDMHSWSGGYGLLDQCNFAVGLRPGISKHNKAHKNIIILKERMPDIASREIRKELKKPRSIRHLVPEQVRTYIKKKKVYA